METMVTEGFGVSLSIDLYQQHLWCGTSSQQGELLT